MTTNSSASNMEDSSSITATAKNLEPVSSSSSCLLCLSSRSSSIEEEDEEALLSLFSKESYITGGGSNVYLQTHLHQLFVLRKILNVPQTWCGNTLKRFAEEKELIKEEDNKSHHYYRRTGTEKWFRLCSVCIQTKVKVFWVLHQEIKELHEKMQKMKTRIREEMETEVRKKRRETGRYCSNGSNWVESEIYEILFPSGTNNRAKLALKEETDFMEVETRSNYSLDLNHNESDSDLSYVPENTPKKRGRGRPPGPGKKMKTTKSKVRSNKPSLPSNELKRPRGRPKSLANKCVKKSKQTVRQQPKNCWHHCTLCPSRFLIAELLASHLEAHKISSEFTCSQCSFPALSGDELQNHIKIRHTDMGYKRKCSECSFIASVRKLKAHMVENHPDVVKQSGYSSKANPIQCSICFKWCAQKQALSTHQRRLHPEHFGDTEKNVKCSQCSLIFPSRLRLQLHLKSTHLKATKLVCDICGKGFWNLKELQRHSAVHNKSGKGDWICAICGLDFKYQTTLNTHMQSFHSSNGENTSTNDCNTEATKKTGDDEVFQCKYCDVKSPFKVVIMRHMKTHTAEMGHGCTICGKFYTSGQGLKRHMNINHPTDQSSRVYCPYCMKEFVHMEYMRQHQLKYCKMKPVECKADANVQM